MVPSVIPVLATLTNVESWLVFFFFLVDYLPILFCLPLPYKSRKLDVEITNILTKKKKKKDVGDIAEDAITKNVNVLP